MKLTERARLAPVLCLALFSLNSSVASDATVEVPLFRITTNIRPVVCSISLTTDPGNAITGMIYVCDDSPDAPKTYSIEQIRSGVVLIREESRKLDVLSVSAPKADTIQGGVVTLRYLTNGMNQSYKSFDFEVANTGKAWTAYTSRDQGHAAFNEMFMEKRSVFGQVVGIKELIVKWVNQSSLQLDFGRL